MSWTSYFAPGKVYSPFSGPKAVFTRRPGLKIINIRVGYARGEHACAVVEVPDVIEVVGHVDYYKPRDGHEQRAVIAGEIVWGVETVPEQKIPFRAGVDGGPVGQEVRGWLDFRRFLPR